ncbi:MAG: heat-inducible transcriptional repressor HrcA [Neomegalonema sp.]|nr:heat-inducible transcriptional repressor HrcA [Neomegalonema sp.]
MSDENAATTLEIMNERSREIFRRLVETYLTTGEPVGSRTLSRAIDSRLSAASIRNVMQDLEHLGLLSSPHVSAGRLPTHLGLRLFVDGMLEIGGPSEKEMQAIKAGLSDEALAETVGLERLMDQAGSLLSGLAGAASLVVAPKSDAAIKHIDFVRLSDDQALAVLVKENGEIENRLVVAPPGLTGPAMSEAANFLNARLRGKTLGESLGAIEKEIAAARQEMGEISQRLVESGVASWRSDPDTGVEPERLIVRGRAHLLDDPNLAGDLERMRQLFDDLERKRDIAQLLDVADQGEGVRIFIGAENKLFSLTGSSLVVSPYMNADQQVVGAIGVIGPTRMNYGRIVPIVDYTAKLMGRMLATARQPEA